MNKYKNKTNDSTLKFFREQEQSWKSISSFWSDSKAKEFENKYMDRINGYSQALRTKSETTSKEIEGIIKEASRISVGKKK